MTDTGLKLSEKSKKMLRKMPGLVTPALFKGMKQAMPAVESQAKSPYLTGKALNVQTGHLRRSVATRVNISGDKVTGSIGTNVSYGRFWELGYSGPMNVRAHSRTIRQAFGRAISPRAVSVRAHTRQVDQKPRPFLRPAIEDKLEQVHRILANTIEEAFLNV